MCRPSDAHFRGLAEALRNELQPQGVKVHLYLPSTIDSPGLQNENKTKPPECMKIEGAQGISPRQVIGIVFYPGALRLLPPPLPIEFTIS
jgi:NAD(P)-dependent dehydrogenase (short-subunit alcohol dehydrogenase family)